MKKLFLIITKSLKEQLRSFWVLLLTLSMGPLFIFIYFLITESWKPHYNILIVNNDEGISIDGEIHNYGNLLVGDMKRACSDTSFFPVSISEIAEREEGMDKLKTKKADVLIILDQQFSKDFNGYISGGTSVPEVEFFGDLTSTNYLIGAIWANEVIGNSMMLAAGTSKFPEVKEIALGVSGSMSEFDMVVPGILILSIIMLMFTASIAFVSEIENKTMMRLKLSELRSMEFLGGISCVQLITGLAAIMLTLAMALILGFEYSGSLLIMIFIAALTSLSIIAFSLIIAAFTKSANEILVVGNFPLFLFMFFTGAAFPMKGNALFTIAGYPVNLQGLMSPTHAISALNKTLVMDLPFRSILPEMAAILILTLIYFAIGAVIFRFRHLRMQNN